MLKILQTFVNSRDTNKSSKRYQKSQFPVLFFLNNLLSNTPSSSSSLFSKMLILHCHCFVFIWIFGMRMNYSYHCRGPTQDQQLGQTGPTWRGRESGILRWASWRSSFLIPLLTPLCWIWVRWPAWGHLKSRMTSPSLRSYQEREVITIRLKIKLQINCYSGLANSQWTDENPVESQKFWSEDLSHWSFEPLLLTMCS